MSGFGFIFDDMQLNRDQCYQAMITHDPRFDGHFFVAVKSTRIYCRPICRSKRPALERCEFFRLAAAAEVAGYRPCLRCRPELAPGQAPADSADRLTAAAVQRIEAGGPARSERFGSGIQSRSKRSPSQEGLGGESGRHSGPTSANSQAAVGETAPDRYDITDD